MTGRSDHTGRQTGEILRPIEAKHNGVSRTGDSPPKTRNPGVKRTRGDKKIMLRGAQRSSRDRKHLY